MIKIIYPSLENKRYTENFLNEMSNKGYDLKKIYHWHFFKFEKRAEDEKPTKYLVSVHKLAIVDLERLGLQRVPVKSLLYIYQQVGDYEKSADILDNKKSVKAIKKNFLYNLLPLLVFVLLIPLIIDLFFEKENVYSYFKAISFSAIIFLSVIEVLVNVVLAIKWRTVNQQFLKRNEGRLRYFDSKRLDNCYKIINLCSLVATISFFVSLMLEISEKPFAQGLLLIIFLILQVTVFLVIRKRLHKVTGSAEVSSVKKFQAFLIAFLVTVSIFLVIFVFFIYFSLKLKMGHM